MDEYAREMMDLKTLVTRTLEKKGVLARIRAELRANVFAAIEEEDHASENEGNPSFALLGSCNERAKRLHSSTTGKLLNALICDYLEWCQLEHTLKVYLPECNLTRGFWKSEIKEKLGQKCEASANKDAESSPLLLEILESYLKNEHQNITSSLSGSFTKLGVRRTSSAVENSSNSGSNESLADSEKMVRRPSASASGGLPSLGRKGGLVPINQPSNASLSVRNYNVGTAADQASADVQSNASYETGIRSRVGSLGIFVASNSSGSLSREETSRRSEEDRLLKNVPVSVNGQDRAQSERKGLHLNSFSRKGITATTYRDSSFKNLEDEVEEDDLPSERESCSSA